MPRKPKRKVTVEKYPGWSAQERLTHGHNKDHRPDLKQLVLGLSVTADGVFPLLTNLDPETHPAKKVLEIYKNSNPSSKSVIRNARPIRKLVRYT